jgi:hypothetical protein
MSRISPKIEIINHFDDLINKIDIDIDSSLEKLNDQQLISELHTSSELKRSSDIIFHFFKTIDSTFESYSESTKLVDYLNKVRKGIIDELKKAQNEALKYYKLNSARFKSEITDEKNIEELKSQLFAEKFYFQIHLVDKKEKNGLKLLPFNVLTFATDFYMSPSDINSLQ